MKNKIQRWSKLEAKSNTRRYDIGGYMEENSAGLGAIGSVAGGVVESTGSPIGSIAGGALKGAAAGMALGPIGALIGGGIGAIGGIIGNAKKKKEAAEQQQIINQQKQAATQAVMLAVPKSGQGLAQAQLAYGGYLTPSLLAKSGIHIAPSKKGTFTAQATKMGMSVQAAASKILGAKEGTYSPEMRKKANFAKNFAKAEGGYIADAVAKMAKGGYANPLSMPNNGLFSFQGGGTHEQNPLGGIPIGKSIQGKKNTVEHGESTFTFPEG